MNVDLPPEFDPSSETVKYLERLKKKAAKNFKWARKQSLDDGMRLAVFLFVWGRIDEALAVAEFLAQKEFTGHDTWYLTEGVHVLAARIHRLRGDAEAANAHMHAIHDVGFVETRLEDSTFDQARGSIAGNAGSKRGRVAWRAILCQRLMFAIEMRLERGEPVEPLEQELAENLDLLRADLKVGRP